MDATDTSKDVDMRQSRFLFIIAVTIGSFLLLGWDCENLRGTSQKEQQPFRRLVAEITTTPLLNIREKNQTQHQPLRSLVADTTVTPFLNCLFMGRDSFSECPGQPQFVPFPGKKGIGLTMRDPGKNGSWVENLPKLLALNVSWNYSWGANRSIAQPPDIEFVPMVFGAVGSTQFQKVFSLIDSAIQSGQVKRVFGYNEPDSPKQGNTQVVAAAPAWHCLESLGVPLASPAAANVYSDWFSSFMDIAQAECLRIDYIAVHWYASPDVRQFQNFLIGLFNSYGGRYPLVITEFAPADWSATDPTNNKYTPSEILSFMKSALPWLEQQSWIAAYAWFPFKTVSAVGGPAALFYETGQLTALGQYYASISPSNIYGDQSIVIF